MMLRAYILRQLLLAFIFAVAGMFFVALPGIAVAAVHKLPDTDTVVLLGYLPLVLQNLAPYVLPIGFLLAVVATYGRLAADKEWTAIQMAGFQPASMLLPALGVAVVLSGTTYWMVSTVLPTLKQREKQFIIETASRAVANLKPGRTDLHLDDFHLAAAYRDADGLFHDAYINKPERPDEQGVTAFARTARLDVDVDSFVLTIELSDAQLVDTKAGWGSRMDNLTVLVPIPKYLEGSEENFTSPRYKTSAGLRTMLSEPDLSKPERDRIEYEIHSRYSMSVVFFMFLLLGAPTGLLMRRGTQLGALAVSVTYALLYYILSMRIGKQLGRSGVVDPMLGAWSTVTFGITCSVFLLRKALKR